MCCGSGRTMSSSGGRQTTGCWEGRRRLDPERLRDDLLRVDRPRLPVADGMDTCLGGRRPRNASHSEPRRPPRRCPDRGGGHVRLTALELHTSLSGLATWRLGRSTPAAGPWPDDATSPSRHSGLTGPHAITAPGRQAQKMTVRRRRRGRPGRPHRRCPTHPQSTPWVHLVSAVGVAA